MTQAIGKKAFTLVEIMIVIAIIGVILAIAMPAFLRAREISRARGCQENLAKIDGAVDMYALDQKKKDGDTVGMTSLILDEGTGYLKRAPECPGGGTYTEPFTVNTPPTCSIGENENAPFAPHVLSEPVPATN